MSSSECLFCSDCFDTSLELTEHTRLSHFSYISQVQEISKEESLNQVERVNPCPPIDLSEVKYPLSDTIARLNTEVRTLVTELRQPEAQVRAWKDLLDQLNTELEGLNGRLEPFGSCCNGFSTVSSDLDLCFSSPALHAFQLNEDKIKQFLARKSQEGLQLELEKRLFDLIVKSLLTCGFSINEIGSKFSARKPILCVESSRFQMDIGVANQVAIWNSRLLKSYCDFDPRVSELGIAIKYWAKQRRLSNAVRRVLCSYAFMLLVIRYLQEELILPNLQQDYPDHLPRRKCGPHDCSFEEDLSLYEEMKGQNNASIGELLVGFFRFYSRFDWERNAVSIAKLQVAKPGNWRGLIAIRDPFEEHRNLGDTVSEENEETIVNEFRRTYKELCEGCSFREVCRGS